jgi:hypothetical protein
MGITNMFFCLGFHTTATGGPGPRIYIPQEQVNSVIPQALGSLFISSYD